MTAADQIVRNIKKVLAIGAVHIWHHVAAIASTTDGSKGPATKTAELDCRRRARYGAMNSALARALIGKVDTRDLTTRGPLRKPILFIAAFDFFGLRPPCDPRRAGWFGLFAVVRAMTFANALEGKERADGAESRPRRPLRRERCGQTAEQVGFGTSGGEGETHPAGCLDDVGGDLDQAQRKVANSALARSRVVGMASRTVSISQ